MKFIIKDASEEGSRFREVVRESFQVFLFCLNFFLQLFSCIIYITKKGNKILKNQWLLIDGTSLFTEKDNYYLKNT